MMVSSMQRNGLPGDGKPDRHDMADPGFFPRGPTISHVDITFEPVAGGTKIEVTHTKIPLGLGKACQKLWKKLYLDPMTKYFG